MRRSEQRHCDPGRSELAGNAAADHENTVDALCEVLVGAPRHHAVVETRRNDEGAGSKHLVHGFVPLSEQPKAGVVSDGQRGCGSLLRRGVLVRP